MISQSHGAIQLQCAGLQRISRGNSWDGLFMSRDEMIVVP